MGGDLRQGAEDSHMNTPDVTVGISFRNPGPYFTLALQSVFAQSFTNWELLLMDDGSTDGSLEFARSLRDPRVRVCSDGYGKSLNVRLNELVSLAVGRYFVRMDADDAMHPDRLKRQIEALEKCGRSTVIGSAAYSIDRNSNVIGMRPAASRQRLGFSARHSFHHPTVAAPVSWFRQNPYSERPVYNRAEDAELWCRTTHHTSFMSIPEPLLFYREMGTTAFGNYLGSEFGILHLLWERHRKPFVSYACRASAEMLKLWFAFVCEGLGKSKWLDSCRYRRLPSGHLEEAVAALEAIKNQPLPV
jgi:glycosyltransferase involved in cell wall biosynthesis